MLKDGMFLCNALRISPVLIESDSSLVVAAIRTERSDHWRFSYVLKEFLALFSSHSRLPSEELFCGQACGLGLLSPSKTRVLSSAGPFEDSEIDILG